MLVGAASFTWLRRFKDAELRSRWLPWLLLGGYSVGTAVLTAMGRAWATKDADTAVSARYIIHAIPLSVALTVLMRLKYGQIMQRHPEWLLRARQVAIVLATSLTLLVLNGWIHGVKIMDVWESARLRGAASRMFFRLLEVEGAVAPNRPRAVQMDELGLLDPPMLRNLRLDNFKVSGEKMNRATARLDNVRMIENKIAVSGLGALHGRRRAADAVLLAYRNDEGDWIIYHVTQVHQMPLYLDKSLDRDLRFTYVPDMSKRLAESLTWFDGIAEIGRLPKGRHEIRAWMLDYRRQTVYPTEGRFVLDTQTREIRHLD